MEIVTIELHTLCDDCGIDGKVLMLDTIANETETFYLCKQCTEKLIKELQEKVGGM